LPIIIGFWISTLAIFYNRLNHTEHIDKANLKTKRLPGGSGRCLKPGKKSPSAK
jgi:hypothetical protein